MFDASHRTQADAVAFRLPRIGPVAASGSGISSQNALNPDLRPSSTLSGRAVPIFLRSAAGLSPQDQTPMREMKLQDLKSKTPAELLAFAEEHEVENASTMRKQELMFAILKQLATQEIDIIGEGVVEVLSDGFGFLRSPEANYLSGPDDIYVSPSQIRRFGLRTGDTVEGHIRSPEGRRALLRAAQGQHHQFRGPREGPPQDQLRQPDAALSRRAAEDGARGSDQEGSVAARHRHRGADRQGPARADRVAAAHRQDRAAAEHRARDHRQPSRVLT